MTEEEEKAIERLEYINRQYDCCDYYSIYDLDCIETILNLIDKLKRENEQLKNEYIIPDYILKDIDELKRENNELKDSLEGHLYTKYLFYKELAFEYQGNCISKDKIKKEIETCKENISKMHPASDIVYMEYLEDKIEILEDLLEDNNE